MRNRQLVAAFLSLAGSSIPALAQDSVSTTNGLPGDAVSAYSVGGSGEQVNNYVVDLTTISSSWAGQYRFAPLIKGSSGGSSFFTTLIGANALSDRFIGATDFPRASYSQWNAVGQGINATRNSAPANLVETVGGASQQFGVAFMEFAGGPNGTFGDGDDDNNIIAGTVNFQLRYPARLYVSRVLAASNRTSFTAGVNATASFGLGGVDEQANVAFSADNFGMTSGSAVQDKRLLRVNALVRNINNSNQQTNTGGADTTATRSLNTGNATSTTVPTLIPTVVAGRPVLLAGDFQGNYLFEQTANSLTSSTAYLPASGSPRGPISIVTRPFSRLVTGANDAATVAVLSRASGDTRTRGISIWAVNTDGSLDNSARVVMPSTVGGLVDPTDGFDPIATFGSGPNQEFTNFSGQVSFRGGSGPVALNLLSNGDLLLAATAVAVAPTPSAAPQGMDNYLAVARVDATTGATSWTIAAHTGNATGANGKAIMGRPTVDDALVPIGRLARYAEVFPGATSGPSISSPAMDALGNLYFLATINLNSGGFTTGLIRAVYDGVGSYQLELLSRVGDIVAGQNSTLNYQIQFMGVADADTVDSGAIFSGSNVQDTIPRVRPDVLPYGSPNSLGALVVRMKIVYDRNNDGQFRDPVLAGNAGSPDQAYNAAMILMPAVNPIDWNSDAFVNLDDLSEFITDFYVQPQSPLLDFNDDGSVNLDDLSEFITDYYASF